MEADLSLLNTARRMDGDTLIKVFDLYAPSLFNYAFRLCNNAVRADQIVGEVFSNLLEHLSAGRGSQDKSAFVSI